MNRKTILPLFIIITIILCSILPFSNAVDANISSKSFFLRNIICIKGIDEVPLLFVSTSNGSLFAIKKGNEIRKISLNKYGNIRKMDYIKTSKLLVAGTSNGYLLFIDPYMLKVVDAVKIFDGEIYLLDATNNGRYVVFAARKSITVSGRKVTAETLIVYDLEKRVVTFLRDWNSNDKLAKVFKLQISSDDKYLVVETLDSFCEFCEILDAKTEIYELETMDKIYSKSLGLAVSMDIWDSLKVISIRRWLRAGSYITEVHLILVSNGKVEEKELTFNFNSKIVKFIGANKFALFLVKSVNNRIGYLYSLNGQKLKDIKGDNVAVVSSYNNSIILTSSSRIYCYDYNMRLLWSAFIENAETGTPIFANCYASGEHAYVAFSNRIVIFTRKLKYQLTIALTDTDNKPIQKATVLIINDKGSKVAEGQTDQYGYFNTYLKNGIYKILLSAYGYTNKTFEIELKKDVILHFSLEKVDIIKPVNEIFVKILNEKGENIEAWLTISDLEGELLYKVLVPSSGLTLSLADGRYNFTAWAEKYYITSKLVELPGASNEVTLLLKLKKYNLTICIVNATIDYANIRVLNLEDYTELFKQINSSERCVMFTNIPTGLYKIKISSGGFYNETIKVRLDKDQNCSIALEKIVQATGEHEVLNVDDIISIFSKKFYVLKIDNKIKSFKARSISGENIDMNSFKGKVIILDFFYTQCEGCKYVIPYLRYIKDKYGNQVEIFSITVSPADTPDVLSTYAQEHNITWVILRDDEGLYQLYNITIFPTILIIDVDGTLVYKIEGSKLEIEQSKERLISFAVQALTIVNQYPDYLLLAVGILLLSSSIFMQYRLIFSLKEKAYEYDEEEHKDEIELFDIGEKW